MFNSDFIKTKSSYLGEYYLHFSMLFISSYRTNFLLYFESNFWSIETLKANFFKVSLIVHTVKVFVVILTDFDLLLYQTDIIQ